MIQFNQTVRVHKYELTEDEQLYKYNAAKKCSKKKKQYKGCMHQVRQELLSYVNKPIRFKKIDRIHQNENPNVRGILIHRMEID